MNNILPNHYHDEKGDVKQSLWRVNYEGLYKGLAHCSMQIEESRMRHAPGSMKSSLSDEFGRRNCIALVIRYTVKALASQERNAQNQPRP